MILMRLFFHFIRDYFRKLSDHDLVRRLSLPKKNTGKFTLLSKGGSCLNTPITASNYLSSWFLLPKTATFIHVFL